MELIYNQWRIQGGAQGTRNPFFSKIITSVIYDKIRLLTEEIGKENSYKCSSFKQFIKLKLKGFIVAHSGKYCKFTLEYFSGHSKQVNSGKYCKFTLEYFSGHSKQFQTTKHDFSGEAQKSKFYCLIITPRLPPSPFKPSLDPQGIVYAVSKRHYGRLYPAPTREIFYRMVLDFILKDNL